MKNELLENARLKLVKHFLDVIVLETILRQGPLSGYDFMEVVHARFDFMVSSGTIYSLLYQLEREGLVEGEMTVGKRVYALTKKGQEFINSVLESKKEILWFVETILTGQ
jgi:DNA-binding PadR family transcriptional regulator